MRFILGPLDGTEEVDDSICSLQPPFCRHKKMNGKWSMLSVVPQHVYSAGKESVIIFNLG